MTPVLVATPRPTAQKAGFDSSAVTLPVRPGTAAARLAIRALHASAVARGVAGARVNGFAGGTPSHGGEAAHLLAGALLSPIALLSPVLAAASLSVFAVSAGFRAAGWRGLGDILAKRPCWNLVLRRPKVPKLLVVAGLDTARAHPALPWAAVAALAVATVGAAFGQPAPGAAMCIGAAAWCAAMARPAARPAAEIAAEADALVDLAATLPPDAPVAIVISDTLAARGDGARAFLDWWALAPASGIVVVGEGPASSALAALGWAVRTVGEPAALRATVDELLSC